jgi:hypothetical protein
MWTRSDAPLPMQVDTRLRVYPAEANLNRRLLSPVMSPWNVRCSDELNESFAINS